MHRPAFTTSRALAAGIACAAAGLIAATSAWAAGSPLKPLPEQKESALWTWRVLERYRYKPEGQTQPIGARPLERYLDMLDADRMLFIRADIDGFEPLRASLEKGGDPNQLDAVFSIFDTMRTRQLAMLAWAQEVVQGPLDFTGHERYQKVRTNAPWAASEAELRALWRKRVMDDVLNLRLAGARQQEIVPMLAERYQQRAKRTRELTPNEVFGTFMNAYVRAYDPHGVFFAPITHHDPIPAGQAAVGLVLQKQGELVTVREVVAGGAAQRSGKLGAGERIVAIGQGEGQPMTPLIGRSVEDTVGLLRGVPGSTVVLAVLAADAAPGSPARTISLVRTPTAIEANRPAGRIELLEQGGAAWRVGVVHVPPFYQDFAAKRAGVPDFTSMSRDVAAELAKLKEQKADAILLDMRGNGGGSLDEAVRFSALFLPGAPIAQQRGYDGKLSVERAAQGAPAWEGPLAVLLDQGSAAATEIFAGAIQDHGRGLVIGDRSVGRTSVQSVINLDRFSNNPALHFGELKMTIAQVFRASGGTFEQGGVKPDLMIPGVIDPSGTANLLSFPAVAIKPAAYAPRGNPALLVPALSQRQAARTASDPRWQAMLRERASIEARRASDEVSLNEAERSQAQKPAAPADIREVQMHEALRVVADELELLRKDPALARGVLGNPAGQGQ
jgi:carboxyl-terminal processing protease